MKIKILILIINLFVPLYSQTILDTVYTLDFKADISPSISFYGQERYPGIKEYSSLGSAFLFRGMWHPGNYLSIGLLTGYVFFVSDILPNSNNASAKIEAIPLQLAVSMEKKPFEIGAAMGSYLLLSTINYGKTAHSIRSELAMTFFCSYHFAISGKITIGPELKITYLSYRKILSIMPSLNICLNILRY